jgi:hypothetical protein
VISQDSAGVSINGAWLEFAPWDSNAVTDDAIGSHAPASTSPTQQLSTGITLALPRALALLQRWG